MKDIFNNTHIMLDLETLGVEADAAIVSVGAVVFKFQDSNLRVLKTYARNIEVQNSLACGGTVSASTLLWWMGREQDKARELFLSGTTSSLTTVLLDVARLMHNYSSQPWIWGNGTDFDNVILASAYKRLGMSVPWQHKQNRCFRTVKELHKNTVPEPEFLGTKHNVLDDALHQVTWLGLIANTYYKE